jgi:hypothetical protein
MKRIFQKKEKKEKKLLRHKTKNPNPEIFVLQQGDQMRL